MTTPTYPDRYSVDCLEDVCALRGCMSPGEDRGSFAQGQGYTSYHSQPKPVCLTRHLRGCPSPLPAPNIERVRCCALPKYPNRRQKTSTCASCGAVRPGWVGRLLNAAGAPPTAVDSNPSWDYSTDETSEET